MQRNDPTVSYINKHQLTSVMNKTKWRELAALMNSNPAFDPKVRVKGLLDKTQENGFSHLDWEWVRHGETAWVE